MVWLYNKGRPGKEAGGLWELGLLGGDVSSLTEVRKVLSF